MSSVLVTGASGFLGRHVVARLRAEGEDVIERGHGAGDIADCATWRRFPRADAVVHLAAKSFVPESWEAPGLFMRTNLGGAIEALEYCRARGAHLIFPSSYMYGDAVRQPISEDTALVAKSPYALSKKLAEEACAFFPIGSTSASPCSARSTSTVRINRKPFSCQPL